MQTANRFIFQTGMSASFGYPLWHTKKIIGDVLHITGADPEQSLQVSSLVKHSFFNENTGRLEEFTFEVETIERRKHKGVFTPPHSADNAFYKAVCKIYNNK